VCPQCGGLINKISEENQMAECSYCGAKIFIERAVEAEKKPPGRTPRAPLEDYKPIDDYDPVAAIPEEDPWEHPGANEALNKVLGAVGAGVVLIFLFVIFGVSTRNKTVPEPVIPAFADTRPVATSYPRGVQSDVPVLTNEDAIKLPKPVIPRKMRIKEETEITVYISIDENGSVYDANAFDGPEELQKIAVEAAKKAKFPKSGNNEKAMGTLVYEFSAK
jgi:DNA-directed RNA polymerase subunit RPC12/RpoP